MTGPYEWNPMPETVSVSCPACGEHAAFRHATQVHIHTKADIPHFTASRYFDYVKVRDPGRGANHIAIYYPGLVHAGPLKEDALPEGYTLPTRRLYTYYPDTSLANAGVIICPACHLRQKHTLTWPRDAYFQVAYKKDVLWAFDRDTAAELVKFISADHRDFRQFRFRHFLMKVPSVFLKAKARHNVSRKLRAVLHAA